jgi:hypothetical protein
MSWREEKDQRCFCSYRQYGGETLSVEKKSIVRHSNKEYIGHPLIILACFSSLQDMTQCHC